MRSAASRVPKLKVPVANPPRRLSYRVNARSTEPVNRDPRHVPPPRGEGLQDLCVTKDLDTLLTALYVKIDDESAGSPDGAAARRC